MEGPRKAGIGPDGLLVRPEVLRRQEREAEDAVNSAKPTIEPTGEGLLDRSKMVEERKTRLEGELAEAAEKPKEGVLDRAKIAEQRKVADGARAQELKKTIEERLSAVEEQVGVDGEKPFSKEGLLNRNFGK